MWIKFTPLYKLGICDAPFYVVVQGKLTLFLTALNSSNFQATALLLNAHQS